MLENIGHSLKSNIYVMLSPYLLLYILIVIIFSEDYLQSDEHRYMFFAENILQGFYSPPWPNIRLWNGPGYPLFLSLLLSFNASFIILRLMNSLLLYLSLIFFYKTLNLYLIPNKKALVYTGILGLYYPIYEKLPSLMTEILAWFLISLFIYLFVKFCKAKDLYILPVTTLTLGFLAMTKVIFGYVFLIMTVVLCLLYVFKKQQFYANVLKLFAVSLLLCIPWLLYTYQMTDKIFYWGNAGGMSLYTMSSPYEEELGDWFDEGRLGEIPALSAHHQVFFDSVNMLNPIQQDAAFKEKAMENIIENPRKYFKNWIANIGRMLFSYPFSYTNQSLKTYFTLIPNMFIVVLIVLLLYPALKKWQYMDRAIKILLLFVFIYLIGSSFLSAYRRQFFIFMPFWFLFFAVMLDKIIILKIKSDLK